jgi:curli biogenesis system outer membrane secretion channel CsgG
MQRSGGLLVLLLAGTAPNVAAQAARPTVAVMEFDCPASAVPSPCDDVGRGAADQLVDRLVDDGRLRLIERTAIEVVLGEQDFAAMDRSNPDAATLARIGEALGVRYVVAGAITKLVTSDRKLGGGTAGAVARGMFGPVGGLSIRKAKQEVSLSARLIDTSTGQVVASAKGAGVAKKGQGVTVASDAPEASGSAAESNEFRASGLGQAADLAVATLATELLAQVGALSAIAPPN